MMNITVIKIGGILLKNDISMIRFFNGLISYYKLFNQKILIVHGENNVQNSFIEKFIDLNKKKKILFYNKYHKNSIYNCFKVGVLSDVINKYIIQKANLYKISTVGLCMTDGNSLILKKKQNDNIIFPKCGSLKLIQYLFSSNIIPIISAVGITQDNHLVRIDSDIVAMSLAIFLKARLIFLTDVSSILDGKGNRIKKIIYSDINKLILEGIITNGMITKVDSAIRFLHYSNKPVDISGWQDVNKFHLLLNGHIIGTRIFYNY